MTQDLKFWISINKTNCFGNKKLLDLFSKFKSAEKIWQLSTKELLSFGISEETTRKFTLLRTKLNPDQELESVLEKNINIVTIDDPNYPKLLVETFAPPPVIFYKGNLNCTKQKSLAIVGTRQVTNYGRQILLPIIKTLVKYNFNIVSGLALGVDALVHDQTVEQAGSTTAILGSGINNVHPKTNIFLAEKILQANGLILSEFPIDMIPLKYNFPMRNRIISGLSLGTLVIEAGEQSGALITAKYALDQNREVFAIPGNINSPKSIGTNKLIQSGAKLVTSAEDILDELNIQDNFKTSSLPAYLPANPEEATILKHLQNQECHINELVKLSNLTISEVTSTLTILEMKKVIRNIGNQTYSRN